MSTSRLWFRRMESRQQPLSQLSPSLLLEVLVKSSCTVMYIFVTQLKMTVCRLATPEEEEKEDQQKKQPLCLWDL